MAGKIFTEPAETSSDMAVQLFGIRHHGPGLARQLLLALEKLRPSVILLEGPPEGEAILKWAADEGMQPPVALLAYVPDEPQKQFFIPLRNSRPSGKPFNTDSKTKSRFALSICR